MRLALLLVACCLCPSLAGAEDASEASAEQSVAGALEMRESLPLWGAVVRTGVGVDDNIDLSRFGSKTTALTQFELETQVHLRKDLRVAVQAGYQKNLPTTTSGDGGIDLFAGYMRELPEKLQLRLSTQLGYRQERSVFADGAILQNTTLVQKILEANVAALLVSRLGNIDLEGGVQGNFEAHSGSLENSNLLGFHAMAGLRYSLRDRVALRARYSYEYSTTEGLSSRNLAGGIDNLGRTLLIGLNRFRFSARGRIAKGASAYVRYDYVSAIDNYSGYLDSHEHVLFMATALSVGKLRVEGNGELARRNFYLRTPTVENPDTDIAIRGNLRVEGWYLPTFAGLERLGVFALYRADYVRADPTGLVFARHIGLSGISGQFGKER